MHAATVIDGDIVWSEHPDPVPGHRELLVAVRAAGLNGADMLQRRGFYAAPPDAPADIPGLELAGEVVATGPAVEHYAIGDRVMAVVGGGGQAELAVVHERTALPVPAALSWAEAGGFAEVFTTAHDALFTQCGLAAGEHLVVHGAAGGVGLAGVQLGLLTGARVTATVRSPELRDRVAALGRAVAGDDAALTVVPHDAWTDRGPVDVVLELVGGPNLADDVRVLAPGGRIAIIGVGGGSRAELDLLGLMGARGRIHGSTLRARPLEQKADAAQRVTRHVLPALATGRVRVPVDATYRMDDARAAYDHFAAGSKLCKIVLTARAGS
ncbi:MAG: alcohol dehydrogenase catalytic domain-containing protein [Actinomycetota bacterium]